MKKIILSLIIILSGISFISCQNEYEKNLNKLSEITKDYINDWHFKDNSTVEIIEYNPINYVMKSETYIDSINRSKLYEIIKSYSDLLDLKIESCKCKQQEYSLYLNAFGVNNYLTKISKEEVEEKIKECEECRDSLNYYFKEDSLLKEKIKLNTNPDSIFMFKVYIKSITYKNNESFNFSDTLYYFYDKNFKIIEV